MILARGTGDTVIDLGAGIDRVVLGQGANAVVLSNVEAVHRRGGQRPR